MPAQPSIDAPIVVNERVRTVRRWRNLAGVALLAMMVNVPAANIDDWWFYVRNDRFHEIEPLLKDGADPNRISPEGQPTIVEAVRTKAWTTFDALAANPKVNIEAANKQGETALMLLSVLGERDRVVRLLDRGAQVNRLGWTPLHYAASRNRLDVAKLLIARKAIINAPSPDGTTPLMMAALSKDDAMVTLLLKAGADPTTRNLSNLSAADWARSSNAPKLAARLDSLMQQRSRSRSSGAAAPLGEAAAPIDIPRATVRPPAVSERSVPQITQSTGQDRPVSDANASSEGQTPSRVQGVGGVGLGTY